MNYYLMEPDTGAREVPRIINWYGNINEQDMEPGRYGALPDITVLFAQMAPNTQFKEVIVSPFLLLPKEAGRLLRMFEPYMGFHNVVLISQKKDVNHEYVFPFLGRYDCMASESILNRDRTVIEHGILLADKIPDAVLFMPQGVGGRSVIIREDFAECLLQKAYFGYHLRQLEIRKDI